MSSELEADGGIYLIWWLAGRKACKLHSRFKALENLNWAVLQVFILIQVPYRKSRWAAALRTLIHLNQSGVCHHIT